MLDYAAPAWLQEFHTFCAAAGDLLAPIAVLVGIIATITTIQRNRAQDKVERLQDRLLMQRIARRQGLTDAEIHAPADPGEPGYTAKV
jgi:hypothetical protein